MKLRRQWAASEATALGWGGITAVAEATGMAWNTIKAGMRELDERAAHPGEPAGDRLRRPGAGRKRLTETDPQLLEALEALVDPVTRGHPESPLRWTCKSTAKLTEELTRRVHDFKDQQLGKAIPYGVYDLASNEGWVSVGITHDTARFAVASIRRWWIEMGAARFPHARKLMITADGGGSNSSRNRLWKVALQELSDDLGLPLHVCHFPPGTSKWNKIEHRLFCFITNNWRGRPLTSLQTIVELIGNTTTETGLVVRAALDEAEYETGIKVSDELAHVKLQRAEYHGDGNDTVRPRKT